LLQAAARHKTAPTATAALGRTLIAAVLLGAYRKEGEQIQVGHTSSSSSSSTPMPEGQEQELE
jgi:molecular chaperone Hsp33